MVIIKQGDPKPAQFKCGYCRTIFEATVGEYYVSYEGSFDEESEGLSDAQLQLPGLQE